MPGDVLAQGRSRRDGLFDQKMHSDAVAVVTSQDIGRCPENVKFTQAASLGKTAIYGRALVRTVRFHELGGPEVLTIDSLASPSLQATDVRIAVKVVGLNRADAMFRRGSYIEKADFPSRIGYEASGIVIEVGEEVNHLRLGDEVCIVPQMGLSQNGCYAEEVVVPNEYVALKPAGLTFAEGAAAWMQYLTPYGALVEIANVQKGDAVLITAASSSVGLAAIQIVNSLGGTAIATTLTGAKKAAVLKAGAAHVIATQEEPLLDSLRSILGANNLKIAFDAVGGPQIAEIAEAISPEGTIIVHGALSPEVTPLPLKIALRKSLTVRGYVFTEVIKDIERFRRAKQFILSGLSEGTLKPVIDRSFKFEEIVAAHHYLESNQQIGKIVVELD